MNRSLFHFSSMVVQKLLNNHILKYLTGSFSVDYPEKIRIVRPKKTFGNHIKIGRLDTMTEQPPRSGLRGLLYKIPIFQKRENDKIINDLKYYNKVIKKEPNNAKAHFKVAKIYHMMGEKEKANAEYLLAAENFSKGGFFAHAIAIYKKLVVQDPSQEQVYLKLAQTFKKMGFLGDAFLQYSKLLDYYNALGQKDKTLEIVRLMAEFDQQKFSLDERAYLKYRLVKECLKSQETEDRGKKLNMEGFFDLDSALEKNEPIGSTGFKEISLDKMYGFEEILKELKELAGPSKAYPNFNYHMGIACREMGFIDEAIEQFQISVQQGQNPFNAATLLGICFMDKGCFEKARESLEKVLMTEGISEEMILEVKDKLNLISKREGGKETLLT